MIRTSNPKANRALSMAIIGTVAILLAAAAVPTAEGIVITKKPKDYTLRPVVQDPGVDGLNLTGLDDVVQFDIDGNGTIDTITWTMTSADTGLFWLDLDKDGAVDSGKELFGSDTSTSIGKVVNGFTALAQYDSPLNGGNGDGALSAADDVWPRLMLWVDWNHDAQVEVGEASTMADLHIQTIDLTSQPVNLADPRGNYVLSYATVHVDPAYGDFWVLDVLFQRSEP